MNPEIKAAWLTALRSGEYRQGKGRLECSDGSFCCLGVLAKEISKMDHPLAERVITAGSQGLLAIKTLNREGFVTGSLSDDFCDDIGLSIQLTNNLIAENDGGMSFAYIADIIEEKA